jgi:predicted CopG family antitoxin
MKTPKWESKYAKLIRITLEDYEWIKNNKGQKSSAKFLEELINRHKNKKV